MESNGKNEEIPENFDCTHLFSEENHRIIKLLGSRGTIEILSIFCCNQKILRFNEIAHKVSIIGSKTLSARLKELEKEGILKRTAYNEIPPRVEYSITKKGSSLATSLMPLFEWILKWTEA